MTQEELAQHLGVHVNQAAALVARLRVATPQMPKRAHVARWRTSSTTGGRRYLRPVFAIGDASDAPKPAPVTATMSRPERRQALRERHGAPAVTRAGIRMS